MSLPELFANSPTIGTLPSVAIAKSATELKAGETTLHTEAPAPSALQASGQFRIVISSEIMIVTAGASGTSWTVTRKAERTHWARSMVAQVQEVEAAFNSWAEFLRERYDLKSGDRVAEDGTIIRAPQQQT
jgi:hypothetical protein